LSSSPAIHIFSSSPAIHVFSSSPAHPYISVHTPSCPAGDTKRCTRPTHSPRSSYRHCLPMPRPTSSHFYPTTTWSVSRSRAEDPATSRPWTDCGALCWCGTSETSAHFHTFRRGVLPTNFACSLNGRATCATEHCSLPQLCGVTICTTHTPATDAGCPAVRRAYAIRKKASAAYPSSQPSSTGAASHTSTTTIERTSVTARMSTIMADPREDRV
jgi:hypothetical protein